MDYEYKRMAFSRKQTQQEKLDFLNRLAIDYGAKDVRILIEKHIVTYAKEIKAMKCINAADKNKLDTIDLPACRDFWRVNPPAPHDDNGKPDFDTLAKYLDFGFALTPHNGHIGTYKNKKMGQFIPKDPRTGKTAEPITTKEDLAYWVNEYTTWGGKHWVIFTFTPADMGMLALDIDFHEGKENGFKNLTDFLINHPELSRADFDTPVYTESASGGKHLYFRTNRTADTKYKITLENCAIDIKGGAIGESKGMGREGHNLTAAGSVKNGNLYVLHGNLIDAPLLSEKLCPFLIAPKPRTIVTPRPPHFTNNPRTYNHNQGHGWHNQRHNQRQNWHYKTLDEIRDWAGANTTGHNYNQKQFAYRVGLYCALLQHEGKDTTGYELADSLQYLQEHPEIFGNDKNTATVNKTSYMKGFNDYRPRN